MYAIAVVIGITDYARTPLRDLPVAANDAAAVSTVLSEPPYSYDVRTFLDGEASGGAIAEALTQAAGERPDLLMFYFAGHGISTALGTFAATVDAQPFVWGVDLAQAMRIGSAGGETSFLCVLDCCHAGAAVFRTVEENSTPATGRDILGTYERGGGSRALIAAAGPDEKAYEVADIGHGYFTYYLLEGLRGGAADHEGAVTVTSLFDVTARPFAENERQRPIFRSDLVGQFVLARGFEPALGPPVEDQILDELEREADALLNGYSEMLGVDPESWRSSGFAEASDRLGAISEWFDKYVNRYPRLLERERFGAAFKAGRNRVAQLGQLEEGMRLREGTAMRVIGRGAFGTVWQVNEVSDYATDLAYKVYNPTDIWEIEKTKRFRRGFEAMKLLDHPRVVPVFRYSEAPLGFFMRYVPGPNLRELDPSTTLEPIDVVRMLTTIVDAVGHAHGRDIIHRDIKPENVVCEMVDSVWEPTLTDFDLAWFSTATQVTNQAMGTAAYAAPEQSFFFSPKAASERRPALDVYSFAQLAFFCLTGSDPVPVSLESNLVALEQRLASWPSGEAAAGLIELYRLASALDPADRIPDFGDLAARLSSLMVDLSPESLKADLNFDQFLRELVFLSTGRYPSEAAPVEFASLSGQTAVEVVRPGSAGAVAEALTFRIRPMFGLSVPGLSFDEARKTLIQRIDRSLANDQRFRRRSPSGPFAVLLDIRGVRLDRAGLQAAREGLTRAIGALEQG